MIDRLTTAAIGMVLGLVLMHDAPAIAQLELHVERLDDLAAMQPLPESMVEPVSSKEVQDPKSPAPEAPDAISRLPFNPTLRPDRDPLLTLEAGERTLKAAVEELERLTEMLIVMRPEAKHKISLLTGEEEAFDASVWIHAKNVPFTAVLEAMAAQLDCWVHYRGNQATIVPDNGEFTMRRLTLARTLDDGKLSASELKEWQDYHEDFGRYASSLNNAYQKAFKDDANAGPQFRVFNLERHGIGHRPGDLSPGEFKKRLDELESMLYGAVPEAATAGFQIQLTDDLLYVRGPGVVIQAVEELLQAVAPRGARGARDDRDRP